MADKTLDLLNQTQIELLQKYDSALNRFNEINNYFENGKAIEAINAENSLKLGGLQMSQIKGIGFKNRVINGDFSIWQRGESFTFGENEHGYTADRFEIQNITDGVFAVSKSFINNKNAIRVTCETPPTNLDEKYFHGINYLFEGQHLYDLVINKKNITISFWFNSNVAGEYPIAMRNTSYVGDNGHFDNSKIDSYITTFIYNTPNIPQKIVITIPLDTTWSYEPANNEKRNFDLIIGFLGQEVHVTSTTNTWLNGENKLTTPTAVNWAAEAGNFIEIAELQVEEGDTATAFEYVPYDIQLQRCMRYYEVIHNAVAWFIYSDAQNDTFGYTPFKIKKRVTPSITFIRPSDGYVGGVDYYEDTQGSNGTPKQLDGSSVGLYAYHISQDGLGFGLDGYKPDKIDEARLVTHIIADAEL